MSDPAIRLQTDVTAANEERSKQRKKGGGKFSFVYTLLLEHQRAGACRPIHSLLSIDHHFVIVSRVFKI
jgi:hypothetical protein